MEGFKDNGNLPMPNYKDVFRILDERDIFSFYVPGLQFNCSINSPIGEKDKNPSFSVFWSYRKLKYMFKDFRYGYVGDCVDLVRYLYGYQNNTYACMKIFKDFGVEGFHIYDTIEGSSGNFTKINTSIPKKYNYEIKVKTRDWKPHDYTFWQEVGITPEGLRFGDIYPISHYFIGKSLRVADKYAYAYVERKDGKITFKIYQPFNKAGLKWRSNSDSSVWELWNQLPDTHDYLIITKSRKDALSIICTMGIPATALQAEGTIPKPQVVDEVKQRFKNVFLFYDNDFNSSENWGQNYAEKISNKFGIPNIFIPDSYQAKDYTDFIKKYSIQEAIDMLWNLINYKERNK